MRPVAKFSTAIAIAAMAIAAGFAPASAACKKMGFLVNDYGKDGPTKDAQLLLDKHIAAWADEKGINEYSVGKKTVECELFLNFIVFNEHTCTASATVCWGGSKQPKASKTQSAKAKSKSKSKTKKAKVDSKTKTKSKPTKSAAKKAAPTSAVVKTVATKTENAKPAKASAVETSALPRYVADPAKAEAAAGPTSPVVPYAKNAVVVPTGTKATPAAPPTGAVSSERAAADRAAAAAERAAAAAERAAAAAQMAAEAAKQAAQLGHQSRSAVVAPVKPKAP